MNSLDIKEKLPEVISSAFMILSLILLFVGVYYIPAQKYSTKLQEYNNQLNVLYQTIKTDNDKKAEKSKQEKEELKNVPNFLERINDTCKAPSILIHSLKPDTANPFKFEITFVADYFKFLKALSEFEKLNISIDTIDIRPYKIDENNPQNFITLQITAINEGEKLSEDAVKFLDYEIAREDKRNPFQRFAKLGVDIVKIIDLTWVYQLSGISRINGENVATIDHNQYAKGDSFEGMNINYIDSTGVQLSKKDDNGVTNFIIKFRQIFKKEQ